MATRNALLLLGLLVLAVVACTQPVPPTPQTPPSPDVQVTGTYEPQVFDPAIALEAQRFGSEEEFAAFVRAHQGGGNVYYARGGVMAESAVAMDAAVGVPAPQAAGTGSGKSLDFSGTNNQVAAVDEADILKTDGEYIYTVTGTTLYIIRAYPGEDAEVVSTIDFKSQPQGLFLEGDRLAVFGNFYDNTWFKEMGIRPRNGMTYVDIYDVSDRKNPERVEQFKFEGNYFQGRMYDGMAYLVLTSGPDYRRDQPMPLIVQGSEVRSVAVDDIYYFPVPYQSVQFATVHSIDLGLGETVDSKTVAVEGSQTLYMNEDHMYLAYTEWVNEWEIRQDLMRALVDDELSAEDRAYIRKIEAADDEVLSPQEKRSKIDQVYWEYVNYLPDDERQDIEQRLDKEVKEKLGEYESLEYTVLTKLSVKDGEIGVEANGQVPGSLNNQFALDEYDGYLRVATTISQRWWAMPVDDVFVREAGPSVGVAIEADAKIAPEIMPRRQWESTNGVYVLDTDLDIVGKLTDLAPGEQIYSTRFVGDRAYVVTFRQVDPFFAIDLSDPRNPEVLGELKIPGFSRYLHPYDADHLIGIGRDATDMGRQQGIKISLFDVSDIENPREVAKWIAGEDYSQTSAEWEHKAFLFDREKELLVIPAYSQSWDGSDRERYNGAMVFRITPTSVKLRGIVDHSTGSEWWSPMVERSLYIEDLLYTKSPNLLRINNLDDLTSVKKVRLEGASDGPYPVY